jgi:hypothetical protein
MARINKVESGCWKYQGHLDKGGYGYIRDGKKELVHRVAYRHFRGTIPEGIFVCHTCDNPSCCNPKHLFLGTPNDNMQDKVHKGRQAHTHDEISGHCKLSVEQVQAIRQDTRSILVIAKEYGVVKSTISGIRNYKLRKYVK